VEKLFPPKFTPYPGQLEALESIQTAFKQGKHFFVLEGPTGFGKSAVAKAVLNLYGKGFITSPLNTLVSQYSRDENLDLTEVRGQSGYVCTVFGGVDCEKASDRFKDHSERCATPPQGIQESVFMCLLWPEPGRANPACGSLVTTWIVY